MKARLALLLCLFSTVCIASEPIKFGPGPTVVDSNNAPLSENSGIRFTTGRIINGDFNFSSYLQDYIESSSYAHMFRIVQYRGGFMYDQPEWYEGDLVEGDAWLITSKYAESSSLEEYVEPVTDAILPCLLSIPSTSKEYSALQALLIGRKLNEGMLTNDPEGPKMVEAILAANLIVTRFGKKNGCEANHDHYSSLDIKPFLMDAVRYVLTGVKQTDYHVDLSAYLQMSRIFKIILFDPFENDSGPLYDAKFLPILDFITSWSNTLPTVDLPTEGYQSYLDFVISIKSDKYPIDNTSLKNIALGCLDNSVSSIFLKHFSLAACREQGTLFHYDIIFKGLNYYIVTGDYQQI